MTLPRAEVERTLQKYCVLIGSHSESQGWCQAKVLPQLVDDLCALPCSHPQPEREGLLKLLKGRLIALGHGSIDLYEPFVDDLLAWAQGTEEIQQKAPYSFNPLHQHRVKHLACGCCGMCECGFGYGGTHFFPRPQEAG